MLIIDKSFLNLGDILLSKTNARIRELSNSEYDHAFLYIGTSLIIEADGFSVCSKSISSLIYEHEDDVILLRTKDNELSEKVNKAVEYARLKIGTEFSPSEARRSIKKGTEKEKVELPNRQFCTRLIAQAYEFAGIKIVESSNYCTPQEILVSKKLIKVKNILRKLSPEEINHYDHEVDKIIELQREIIEELFSLSREVTNTDIQTFTDLFNFVLNNRDREEELKEVLIKSNFLKIGEATVNKFPWFYNFENFKAHFNNSEVAISRAKLIIKVESLTRGRYLKNLISSRLLYKIGKQEYFKLIIESYEKLLKLSYDREKVAKEVIRNLNK